MLNEFKRCKCGVLSDSIVVAHQEMPADPETGYTTEVWQYYKFKECGHIDWSWPCISLGYKNEN